MTPGTLPLSITLKIPEDWSAPFDDIETDDLGYTDTDRHARPDAENMDISDYSGLSNSFMKMSPQQFLDWESKSITLLAMSGAGKTTLSNKLPKDKWFHYSGDYRIGTKYLEEPILDNIKQQAMGVPFLRDLLKSDSIYFRNNITVDNLAPISSFLGKIGSPAQGGLSLAEFKRRQALHHQAEIAAMNDVPAFIHKAEDIYGYKHFINDAGGSVCELDSPRKCWKRLARTHSDCLYQNSGSLSNKPLSNAPKTIRNRLYYRPAFIDEKLDEFMREHGLFIHR